LVASTGFALLTFGYSLRTAQRLLRVQPLTLVAIGLAFAAASGLFAWINGTSFLTGLWIGVPLPGNLRVDLGTPLLFDIGVYLTVIGATLTMLFAFAEE
jgi:multisubunit Na+/H+ antiporter MnhB subunit